MSREAITAFSYKNTKSTKIIELVFPVELYNRINQMSDKYSSTLSNTIRTLIYVSLKNNFTQSPSYDYIPCKQRSDAIPYSVTTKRKPENRTTAFVFKVSDALDGKLKTVAEKYYATVTQTVRMLVSIALQYNYDETFNFVRAAPLSDTESNNDMQMPTIFLDII